MMFDLYLLPIALSQGQDQATLTGFRAVNAPRRAERLRQEDILLMHFQLMGGSQPAEEDLNDMLGEVGKIYYAERGTVTSGLRSAVERLNTVLYAYNQQKRSGSRQYLGLLNLAVVHHNMLYLAQSGPVHAVLFGNGQVQEFYNPATAGRGLGLTHQATLAYANAGIENESLLLFAQELPAAITAEGLAAGGRPSMNNLRKRLLAADPLGTFQVGLTQFKPGNGEIHTLRTRPESPFHTVSGDTIPVEVKRELPQNKVEPTEAQTESPKGEVQGEPISAPPEEPVQVRPQAIKETAPLTRDMVQATPFVEDKVSLPSWAGRRKPVPEEKPKALQARPLQIAPRQEAKPWKVKPEQRKQMASSWQKFKDFRQKSKLGLKKFLARVLPGASDQSPQVSPGTMLFIALAVPLVIVAIATTIYLRGGRAQQHESYLAQARQTAAQAVSQTDPAAQREDYQAAVNWLDEAEKYGQTDASRELRQQVYASLDTLDAVTRLEFYNAFTSGFAPTVNFTQIAMTDTDAYLLDSSLGRVMRLFLTGKGYDLDTNFQCGPISSGTQLVGSLVDILALPSDDGDQASVMGIDEAGNILKCIPGAEPKASLLTAPEIGWGKIAAAALDHGNLYVLDTTNNMIYIYWNYFSAGGAPEKFFSLTEGEMPPTISSVIDLTVNGEDLYMLQADSSMITCKYAIYQGYRTDCNPALYSDTRRGLEAQTLAFADTQFTRLMMTQRINPALYTLDAKSGTVYRFSLKLNLDRLFRPSPYNGDSFPDSPATAFAFSRPSTASPSELVFIAFGNQVFYANVQ